MIAYSIGGEGTGSSGTRELRPAARMESRMDPELSFFETEMNRGFLQVLVLVALEQKTYGYAMIKHFEEMGYAVEENTLYPLLRRLEKNGWITSLWDVTEDRPKKFYRITEKGRTVRKQALEIWAGQNETLERMKEEHRNV
jgi:PadR family transcriptional regulator PadR